MALPIDPQPTPMVPTVVPSFLCLHPIILPSLPLFNRPHSLHIYDPKKHIMWEIDITEVGRGTHFIKVEDWDNNYFWSTCQMDNTESLNFNAKSATIF